MKKFKYVITLAIGDSWLFVCAHIAWCILFWCCPVLYYLCVTLKKVVPISVFIPSPAQCILQFWACYCEGDDHDNWRTGLWWDVPPTGGWGWNCLSTSLLHSLDYLPSTDTSPVEQYAGKLLIFIEVQLTSTDSYSVVLVNYNFNWIYFSMAFLKFS